MIGRNTNSSRDLLSKSLLGTKPLIITTNATYENINGYAIYAITDTTFTTLQAIYDGDNITTSTLLAGHIWYIPIKGIVELTTGSVIIYQNSTSAR